MKRRIYLAVVVCLSVCLLAGCQSKMDEPIGETADEKTAAAWLTGEFTVTVQELLPDYVFDDTTLHCAVVTPFQGKPYVLYLGDRTAELEIGAQYTFTVKDKPLPEVPESEIGSEVDYMEACVKYPEVEIESFRKAKENELGLGGGSIMIVGQAQYEEKDD